jgi:hypothetical protein
MASATASRLLSAALAAALLLPAQRARADVSAADKAAAEALFEHAKLLVKDGRYGEACPKFQESLRIDPGIGVMLYLADCFEKNGQTASAWAQFLEAAAAAKAAAQPEREKKARDRAASLEPRLNRLSITLAPGADTAGLEVKRDGSPMKKALLGTPVPLDPGEHLIEVTALAKKPWSTKVKIDPAVMASTLSIPVLEDLPAPPPPKVEPPPPPPPKVEPPPPASLKALPPPKQKDVPVTSTRDTITPGRIVGGTFIGVGLAGAAVGGILGAVALQKNASANELCLANGLCTQAGIDARNAARGLAKATDVSLIAGSALFATGLIVLLSTGPSSEKAVLSVRPLIGGLSVGGTF